MKQRKSSFGALSSGAKFGIFSIVVVLIIIIAVIAIYSSSDSTTSPPSPATTPGYTTTTPSPATTMSGSTTTPSAATTITTAAKTIVTAAKALITPAPTTKKATTPAPTTKKKPTQVTYKYPKVVDTIGSNGQFNCPGADKVLSGGTWCMFPTKEEAEKYCDSAPDCAGYSIANNDPNNKVAQVTSKSVLGVTPNTDWDWFPKST